MVGRIVSSLILYTVCILYTVHLLCRITFFRHLPHSLCEPFILRGHLPVVLSPTQSESMFVDIVPFQSVGNFAKANRDTNMSLIS